MLKKVDCKVWLNQNPLTKEIDNDYVAEVSTAGNAARNEDIASQIVASRSELRYETILSVLTIRDEVVRNFVVQGFAVQDGCVRIAPRVSGSWLGLSHKFDPLLHRIGLDVSPCAEMRAALEYVGIEVLGEKDSGAFIGLVTDLSTGKSDGTITPDEDVAVTGDKIRIAPEDEAGLGVFFVDSNGVDHSITHRLAENQPKKLLFRVPALADGVYTLKVVTRFSNSTTLVHDPRVIIYEFPLKVETAPSTP
jgi:hypothetical protein